MPDLKTQKLSSILASLFWLQGPCIANQMALANSRLWDATSGFLMVLAKLQKQLLHQSTQLELFRELVKVEKDLFILLLSMLEGN